jgi:protein-tyrosine phosphatase
MFARMKNIFWLIDDQLGGRTGPDVDPWDLPSLRAGGVGAILSFTPHEIDPAQIEAAGIAHTCILLTGNAPPLEGDAAICRDLLPKALDFVQQQIDQGRAVIVHCTSGKDRTGLFLSYYLTTRQGLSPRQAIDKVRRVRPIALSAEGWEPFALDVLGAAAG